MNIIASTFVAKEQLAILKKVVEKIKPDYCLHIHTDLQFKPSNNNCAMDYYLWDDAIMGKYPQSEESLQPLDSELISQMSECETIVLKMMDRFEHLRPYFGNFPYVERKRLYLKYLRFWNHIINTKKINLFLSASVPHECFDFVVYSLCLAKKIPCLLLRDTTIKDSCLIMKNWKEPMPELKENYDKLNKKNINGEVIALNKKYQEYFDWQSSKKGDPTPFYMEKSYRKTKNKSILVYLKKIAFAIATNPTVFVKKIFKPEYWIIKINKSIRARKYLKRKEKMLVFYNLHTVNPDLSKKYFYVPLHYQPELSTSPLAGYFVDQILVIQLLASQLPKNVFLYVKEHPLQHFNPKKSGRDLAFYQDLIKYPQVKLVPVKYNSFRLVENCLGVATSSGAAGWEALFRQKPVLLFGSTFYQYAPHVFPIRTINDCQEAINKIIIQKDKSELNETKIFLKAMELTTIDGYIDPAFAAISEISREENCHNVSEAIINQIQKLNIC